MGKFDFSHLPDVIWVKVLKQLSLADRSHVALTCHRLNGIFGHPSIWYTVEIILIGNLPAVRNARYPHRPGRVTGVVVPDRYLPMIDCFGDYFQNLRLIVRGDVFKLQDACRDVLLKLAKCRLESLVLKIGEGTVPVRRLPSTVVETFMAVLKEAHRLKRLDIEAWPMRSDDDGSFDLLECIRANKKITNLERLSLFWWDASKDSWVPLVTCLPSPAAVVKTVNHFSSLKSLCLRSSILNAQLLEELSKPRRVYLARLGLLVTYNSGALRGYEVTSSVIQDSTWKRFRESNPGVKVDFTFSNTIPAHEFISLLNNEIPVSGVLLMKYVRYQPHMLNHIASTYHQTLTEFADYGDDISEKILLDLVTRCSMLNKLTCHGGVSCATVLRLADLRKQSWKLFAVAVNLTAVVDDEDLVLQPNDDGGYAIVAHLPGSQFYHTDDSEQAQVDAVESLCQQVSNILGCRWKPFTVTV